MSEKRLYSYDKGNNKVLCNLNDVCDFNVSNVFQLLNSLSDENEQLKKYCTVLKNQIKKMGELGGFNKYMLKTILESNYDD